MPDSSNFHLESRFKNIQDSQRSWLWNLVIPNIKTVCPQSNKFGEEDLIIRCRSFAIPPKSNTPTESDFMGMKQYFPGRPTAGGTIAATFEETEDQRILQMLYEWQQGIFNINPSNPLTAGKSKFPLKRVSTRDIFLVMFGYDGKPLSKSIRFVNAWPQSQGEVSLDYAGGGNIIYSISFQYDFWTTFPDTTI